MAEDSAERCGATDEFAANKNLTKSVEVQYPGSIIVSLTANPTTGFVWEDAVIEDEAIVQFYERNYVAPSENIIGAAGKEVWTFKSERKGATTIGFAYHQSGSGQEEWSLTLNVTVK